MKNDAIKAAIEVAFLMPLAEQEKKVALDNLDLALNDPERAFTAGLAILRDKLRGNQETLNLFFTAWVSGVIHGVSIAAMTEVSIYTPKYFEAYAEQLKKDLPKVKRDALKVIPGGNNTGGEDNAPKGA